jgi:hypothetical protein
MVELEATSQDSAADQSSTIDIEQMSNEELSTYIHRQKDFYNKARKYHVQLEQKCQRTEVREKRLV